MLRRGKACTLISNDIEVVFYCFLIFDLPTCLTGLIFIEDFSSKANHAQPCLILNLDKVGQVLPTAKSLFIIHNLSTLIYQYLHSWALFVFFAYLKKSYIISGKWAEKWLWRMLIKSKISFNDTKTCLII